MDSRVQYETPEEGGRTYRLKRSGYNNKDEVNSPNILSNNNKCVVHLALVYNIQFI